MGSDNYRRGLQLFPNLTPVKMVALMILFPLFTFGGAWLLDDERKERDAIPHISQIPTKREVARLSGAEKGLEPSPTSLDNKPKNPAESSAKRIWNSVSEYMVRFSELGSDLFSDMFKSLGQDEYATTFQSASGKAYIALVRRNFSGTPVHVDLGNGGATTFSYEVKGVWRKSEKPGGEDSFVPVPIQYERSNYKYIGEQYRYSLVTPENSARYEFEITKSGFKLKLDSQESNPKFFGSDISEYLPNADRNINDTRFSDLRALSDSEIEAFTRWRRRSGETKRN